MFCSKCGKPLAEDQSFCPACGHPQAAPLPPKGNLLTELSSKIKLEAYIWLGVAVAQVIIGLINIFTGFSLNADYEDGSTNIVSGFIILAVAVSNFLTFRKDMEYSEEILQKPIGIVEKFKPVNALVITLVYNLILGGLIGVVGSIFGFLTRNFVITNEAALLEIEANQTATSAK